jgi:hypothetical protein
LKIKKIFSQIFMSIFNKKNNHRLRNGRPVGLADGLVLLLPAVGRHPAVHVPHVGHLVSFFKFSL